MTEQEWLASDDPAAMLASLRFTQVCISQPGAVIEAHAGRDLTPTDRKLRLFAVACCRAVWALLADQRSRKAVKVAERFADGEATANELDVASQAAYYLTQGTAGDSPKRYAEYLASNVAFAEASHFFRSNYCQWPERAGVAPATQAALLREVAGNPFRPVKLDTSLGRVRQPETTWFDHRLITPTVLAVAQECYESRRFEELPILADALEEAGCTDDAVLSHLRSPGPHVRGCWALDLILGKT